MDEAKCGALLGEVSAGSTQALAELYTEAGRAVFAYALSIVRSRQLAEDVTQDVFVRIRLTAGHYTPRGHACGWIMRLTHNTALDLLKKRTHELPEDTLSTDEAPGNSLAEATREVSADEMLMLREALEKLPRMQRQIVLLYLVAGIPQKEIARVLRLPVTTVNWQYRASLKKLSNLLNREES
ncbi:MAG: RNA polymerase sigma factor [Clostridia bacterium]|nr:RNA polymerase sigma factor [Clostridia bacterium]